jgi:epoxyqueuosine reductase
MAKYKKIVGLKPASPNQIRSVARKVSEGASRYVVEHVEKFDQKNDIFKRTRWDSKVEYGKKYYSLVMPKENKPGYTHLDMAFKNAAWWVELAFAQSVWAGKVGLLAWESKQWGDSKPPDGLKLKVEDPQILTQRIKKVGKFFGADLVGVCELDRRWIYSHSYNMKTQEYGPVQIPQDCKYAIVLAVEMDYEAMKCSPNFIQGAAGGLGYSAEAFAAGLLAQFVRALGYKALPQGNDTSCGIPIAIDAGLGELSRSGLLITPKFGPRVRIAKIFTDLPLRPDGPIEFGVWDFCRICRKCVDYCPSKAIIAGEPTADVHNISNRYGLLRWPVNAEKCIGFWAAQGSCSNCIRVCPFNKPAGLLHAAVKWGVKHVRWLHPLFIWADDRFHYGKQKSAKEFWGDT